MKHFLLIFDRARSRILRQEEFDDGPTALRARFSAEREHAGDRNIEVVVLGATSEAVLRRTHARYFRTVGELIEDTIAKLS
jgi:hypothetical protein